MPAGSLTSANQDISVRATADLQTPEQFENLILGNNVRLGDIATVTLGPDIGTSSLRSDGRQGIGLGIIRQAQSNTLDISEGVKKAVTTIAEILPPGTQLKVTSDDAVFIEGAIHEVEIALVASVIIVTLVIYMFLLDWRATLIPTLTMPIALIGTCAAIYLAGFSINILTLLAIVLATGLVVDDAIVVLENIVRRRGEGMGPRAAAVLGTLEVFFAVIATTATLAAVFVPLSFLPGQTGGLFREFGFVLAFAILLSAFVSLTLCPMLASRMLKPHAENHGHTGVMGRIGTFAAAFYKRTLRACLNSPLIVFMVAIMVTAAGAGAFTLLKSELTPTEDRSRIMVRIQAPQGVSLEYTQAQMRRVEDGLKPLVDNGEIANVFSVSGQGGSVNTGFMVLTLAPWSDRERTQQQISADITKITVNIPSIRAFPIQPNSLGIRGAGNGLQVALVGNDYAKLGDAASKLVRQMEDSGRFENVRLNYEANQAQLSVTIDRERASDLGIDIVGLSAALQAMLDGNSVLDVYVDGEAYPVKLLSTTNPVNDPTDLQNIFLKTGDGKIVPMSTIATVEERAVAPQLSREQQLRSVSLSAGLTSGIALGDALTMVEQMAEPLLPPGSRVVPLAEAATLDENANGMFVTFGFALVIIFLVLAAQFESLISGLIIMSTVPLGLACAVFAMLLTGNTLNIYSQIGLVLFGRHHGEERHPDRRICQSVARPWRGFALGNRERGQYPAAPGDDDDDCNDRRGGAAGAGKWSRRRGPCCARLGAGRRSWACNRRDALSDASRLPGDRSLHQAACRRGAAAAERDAACRDVATGGSRGITGKAFVPSAVRYQSVFARNLEEFMHTGWEEVWPEIERLVAEHTEAVTPQTLGNLRDFIASIRERYAVADDFGPGYRSSVRLCWSNAKPAPVEIEVFEDHYEFYQFFDGRTDIQHFSHSGGGIIPRQLIEILNACLPAR